MMVKSNLIRALGSGAIVVLSASLALAGGHGKGGGSVCDESDLVGSAYAACHVYCESLDCDGVHPNGSATACDRSLDRFMDLTGELPPCEPACPCAVAWRAAGFFLDNAATAVCFIGSDGETNANIFVEMTDDEGTYRSATADIFEDDNPNLPYYSFSCATIQDPPAVEGTGVDGGFELANRYFPESRASWALRTRLFNSCVTELEALVAKFGFECESEAGGN
jgi:hypothetical protein